MEWLCDNIIGIIAIVVAIIIGVIGEVRLRVKIKTINLTLHTGAGSIYKDTNITNNSGIDPLEAVKVADAFAEEKVAKVHEAHKKEMDDYEKMLEEV